MSISIRLDNFEGPFDLLCHLLDENQVDIYDIPIAEITRQYLSYLEAMSSLDLEVASEFLVLAATLIAIKTKMLLPVVKKDDGTEFPEGYYENENDPRSDLVRQILEYKKYRELAESFSVLAEKRNRQIVRPDETEMYVSLFHEHDIFRGFSLDKLGEAMETIIGRMGEKELFHRVQRENVTIEDQIRLIELRLREFPEGVRFAELCRECEGKMRIIVLFLALLEMIRRSRIAVLQKANYGEIIIFPTESVSRI
jgi:segregation and condensation protein A